MWCHVPNEALRRDEQSCRKPDSLSRERRFRSYLKLLLQSFDAQPWTRQNRISGARFHHGNEPCHAALREHDNVIFRHGAANGLENKFVVTRNIARYESFESALD